MTFRTKSKLLVAAIALILALVVPAMSMPDVVTTAASSIGGLVTGTERQTDTPDEYKPSALDTKNLHEPDEYDTTEIIAEDTSKRTATSKTFVQADGTYVFQDYGTAVHFFDGEEFVEIDNTLNSRLENTQNDDFKVSFNQGYSDQLVSISNNSGSISMTPIFEKETTSADIFVYDGKGDLTGSRENVGKGLIGKNQNAGAKANSKNNRLDSGKPNYKNNLASSLDSFSIETNFGAQLQETFANNSSSIYYSNLYENIDIEYILEGTNLKENIIIYEPLDEYRFTFELNLDGLFVMQTAEGDILITDETGETVYIIPSGYMYDANRVYSYEVHYTLEFVDELYFLTVVADSEFFEYAAFPVVVDPSVLASHHDNIVFATGRYTDNKSWVDSKFITGRFFTLGLFPGDMRNAFIASTSSYVADIISNNENVILSADLKIYYNKDRLFEVELKSATDPYALYSATVLSFLTHTKNTSEKYITIDVDEYIKNHLGKSIISIRDIDREAETTLSNPYLTIRYCHNSSEYTITQDLGNSGVGAVDLFNGRLSYALQDAIVNDAGFMPISISHIYGASFDATTYHTGNKFKLNIQQKIIYNGDNYCYNDSIGRMHYFTRDDIPENKVLGLKLYKNDGDYENTNGIIRLIDAQGNSLVFNNGYLIQMHQFPSRYENQINSMMLAIGYASSPWEMLPISVFNGCTTLSLQWRYEYGLGSIVNAGTGTLLTEYQYTGDRLDDIKKYSDIQNYYITTFSYNNSRLIGILSDNGDNINYNYTSVTSATINQIKTQNINSGGSLKTINISYVSCSTNSITNTTILELDNKYHRHVSFKNDFVNKFEIVSDYAYEMTGNGDLIPAAAYSNSFDYMAFAETYANTRDLFYAQTITISNPNAPNNPSSRIYYDLFLQPGAGAGKHNYAFSAWVKLNGNAVVDFTTWNGSNGGPSTRLGNSSVSDWQFVSVVVEDAENITCFPLDLRSGTSAEFKDIKIVRLTKGFNQNQKEEFKPKLDSQDRLFRFSQYNAIDNSISMYEYEYTRTGIGNYVGSAYPDLIASITEYTGSADLTEEQYISLRTQKSKVVYTYNDGLVTNIKTYGSSSTYTAANYIYTNGRLTSYTDVNGRKTNYSYNNGVLTTTVTSESYTTNIMTTNTYQQGTGALSSTTTGGITTGFGYNNSGALSTITHNGFNTTFGYSLDGSLQSIGVPGKTLVSYDYSQYQDSITYHNDTTASIPAPVSFATDSWETINLVACKIASDPTYVKPYAVGDRRLETFSTNEQQYLVILGFRHDNLSDGSGKAGITIGMENLLNTKYKMNSSATTVGGWDSCEMRTTTMPLLYSNLPNDLRGYVQTVDKLATSGNLSTALTTSQDKLFLLSHAEIRTDGSNGNFAPIPEGTQYQYWSTRETNADRIKYLSNGTGTAYNWWLRSPATGTSASAGNFVGVHTSGSGMMTAAYSANGIGFAFCIGRPTVFDTNQTIKYNYDNNGYLTDIINSDSSTTSFIYNEKNELHDIYDASGVLYQYRKAPDDVIGNIYKVTNNSDSVQMQSYPVDANGNNARDTYFYNGVLQDYYKYVYNSSGLLSSINKNGNGSVSYIYDSMQRLSTKGTNYSGGSSFLYNYTYATNGGNATYLPATQNFKVNSVSQSSYAYQYYGNGNLSSMSRTGNMPNSSTYSYDQYNRLVQESNSTFGTTNYTYDTGGNITSMSGARNISYVYDNLYRDQLNSFTLGSTAYNILYDGAGNPTTYKNSTLTWKNGRQLASYGNNSYDYDYAGIRTSKTVNGATTYYYYEGDRLLAEKTNGILTWFYYDESGIAGMNCGGVDCYFEKNILGDVIGIYNTQTGEYIGGYIYDAWGVHTIVADPGACPNDYIILNCNPFRYRGYYYDSETQLYYLNSRYYDPWIGRFLSPDKPENLFISATVPFGANLYAYCGNNPIAYTDPSGEFFLTALIIAAVTFAVVNTATQLVSDVINYAATGQWNSGWEEYVGAFGGGLLGGATFLLTGGNLPATFAVMGGTQTLSTNLLTNATGRTNYNGWQILGNTALSAGIGLFTGAVFGGVSKAGITAGRNSFTAVWKSGLTKLVNGTAARMSAGVMMKGVAGIAVLRSGAAVVNGLVKTGIDWVKNKKVGWSALYGY